MQGATEIALTKLDVLSYMESIPVCTAYETPEGVTREFPFPALLDESKPIVEYVKGWNCDIGGVRRWEDLPAEARDYVTFIEDRIGCPVKYVSVGPERESIIIR